MKTLLKIATVLTWFNLLFWGILIVLAILSSLLLQTVALLIGLVLLCAIPLNSYAALQLQKSIRQPVVKLSNSTPTGIRFVGFVALFFAISFVINGFTLLGNTEAAVRMFKEGMSTIKNADLSQMTTGNFRKLAGAMIFLGLCVGVNVILNLRLLRWYYLVRQSDVS